MLAPVLLGALLTGCGGSEGGDMGEDPSGPGGKADDADPVESAVCLQAAAYPNSVLEAAIPGVVDADGWPMIANYTSWPIYDANAQSARMDAAVTNRIEDPDAALANIASRYGDCEADMVAHLETAKPNVYIYFTGFGGADQNNSLIDEGAVLRWINERDPSALIFSINWNCAASSDSFCFENTEALAAGPDARHVASMDRAIDVIVPQITDPAVAQQLKAAIGQFGEQQSGYDSAHSHSMHLAAQLIDQLLVLDKGGDGDRLGDIRIAGYSMGAHSAAQLLVQDFNGDGSGYSWTANGCEDGSSTCTVAQLDKVKWSLAMGLSGWSHALRSHNGLDGGERRSDADRAQYENGGLFRVADDAYRGKLAVLNRRMDPTSNSDDTYQRGFNDIFFADYNHYSHDYSLPLFIDVGLRQALDAYLEFDSTAAVPELGIIHDNAGKVDFDDCTLGESCEAGTGYLAHETNRSHAVLDIPRVGVRETTDGVEHPDRVNNVAARMSSGADPIVLRTFEQEDLRGGVELYYRPNFEMGSEGLRGIFSYGACEGTNEDLMPEAYMMDGELAFGMWYEGEPYIVSIDAASAGIETDTWSHLAFTWELPVESLTVPHESDADLAAALPGMIPDLEEHQVALALATGLTKPMPTTYKRQSGEGTMTIYVNGRAVAEASLGTPMSERRCLPAAEVLSRETYDVNGTEYDAFVPYAGYDPVGGDTVAFSASQVLGTKCKAYRVRNTEVFFGCAGDEATNADADMDDITLVWGPGRTRYSDVDSSGQPSVWPVGVSYGPERLVVE